MKVKLDANATGNGSLHLDDKDVSRGVRGVRIDTRVGHLTRVELDVLVHDGLHVEADVLDYRLSVPKATHDLLVALGWTPPETPAPPAG